MRASPTSACGAARRGEFSHADDVIAALDGEPAALVGASYCDLCGAATLNADFWLESEEARERVIEMQERAFDLEAESEADSVEPESIDLGRSGARTLVAVGEGRAICPLWSGQKRSRRL
jgi:hypothetical protein